MKIALIALVLVAGCTTQIAVPLPLYTGDVSVPHFANPRGRENYVAGFRDGWIGTLRVFSEDIDHHWALLELSASGRPPAYWDGYSAASREAEALVSKLVVSVGGDAAKEKLRAAIRNQNLPNKASDSTTSARTSAAEQPRVPASAASHL
jgi:hypothetical protein